MNLETNPKTMKNDHILTTIAITTTILGILFLFFLTKNAHFEKISINKLQETTSFFLGKSISIEGVVSKIQQKEKYALITILEPKETSVLVFKANPSLDLKEGDYIIVYGKLESFNQKPQIIAYKIVKKQK